MELKKLNEISEQKSSQRLLRKHDELTRLIDLLRSRDLPSKLLDSVNRETENINSFKGTNRELLRKVRSAELRILKQLEKDMKLVPKNTYRTRWMAIGMSVFGVPIGVAFGAGLGNMAFLAIGIPIGMSIGIAVGALMDKKAFEEGRQLDIEISPQ
jgi:hypothetical protein